MSSSTEPTQGVSEYQDNLEIFREIPFFSGLPLEPLKVLAYLSERRRYNAGDVVFQKDEVDQNAYYVLEGSATLLVDGAQDARLKAFKPGDFIGGLSLVGDMKRLFSLQAEKNLVVIVLSRQMFQKTLEQFPDILYKFLEAVVEGVYDWERRLLNKHALTYTDCLVHLGVTLV
ncbi:MAG: Crp/Fnr family transcriptional regulator [Desulfovibrionaceae bacterium]